MQKNAIVQATIAFRFSITRLNKGVAKAVDLHESIDQQKKLVDTAKESTSFILNQLKLTSIQ
jgi:hypothetical protein